MEDLRLDKKTKSRNVSTSEDKYKDEERTRHSKWIFLTIFVYL